jgi:hypothetical protein
MAKKRKAIVVAKRALEPAVRVVERTRAKLSRGEPHLSGGAVAATLGGAVAGSVATHGLVFVGASPMVASLGVAGVGGVGALLLDGKAQAAAAGAAAGGLVLAASTLLAKRQKEAPKKPPEQLAQPRRQAALPPADVQAAFDAARAQLRRRPAYGFAEAA